MALPPNQEPSQPSGSPQLPASYRNPWLTLGESLQAVLADTRLRLQELWRRNGEGDLWRPGWWPRDLAPLFWPLLVSLSLALVLALGVVGAQALQRWWAASPAEQPRTEAPSSPQPTVAPAEAPMAADPSPVLSPAPEAAAEPLPAAPPAPDPQAEPLEQPPPDPLAEFLQRPEAVGLLTRARPTPDQLTLVLQVSSAFEGLPLSSQQRHADQWQQWAVDLGYDHLELRDSRSGLLARDAVVGSGMIVLSESAQP